MKPEMEQLIREQTQERAKRLGALDGRQRTALIELLIEDFFVGSRRTLAKWSTLTGQSAQIDTGYIAQHMASVTLGIPGQGFKGKGLTSSTRVRSRAPHCSAALTDLGGTTTSAPRHPMLTGQAGAFLRSGLRTLPRRTSSTSYSTRSIERSSLPADGSCESALGVSMPSGTRRGATS